MSCLSAGTNGADGGLGGNIFIRVSDRDSYYLMAFRCLDDDEAIHAAVRGGIPGRAGKHGSPGQGRLKYNKLEMQQPVVFSRAFVTNEMYSVVSY